MSTGAIARPTTRQIHEPTLARLLFADPRLAPLWLLARLYVGYEWLRSGWDKLAHPAGGWVGDQGGAAITGFINDALQQTAGAHPDVTGWYAAFLREAVLPNAKIVASLVTVGEILVGIGLLLGLFTGLAAFVGGALHANFLLAGTVSTDPVLFIVASGLVLAWRVAGYHGLDRWALPLAGIPGAPGVIVKPRAPRDARKAHA